ncbi:hypothetical protein L228DRAFT_241714 [Xylona heveae TC161]|uniref:Uncharacterized protein n=1 Tax=Xylona heveae (strain CBS 132557 / TC161) TaxID=1328760 RepID=A0A164ZTK2_XYLHT|nr:hypothetical protein L228DRAFT_241714 [Xylona heveae TC161]KZF19495.1 hypothetical protein L228DRAFT_241714 [Xylona heveae TC161]
MESIGPDEGSFNMIGTVRGAKMACSAIWTWFAVTSRAATAVVGEARRCVERTGERWKDLDSERCRLSETAKCEPTASSSARSQSASRLPYARLCLLQSLGERAALVTSLEPLIVTPQKQCVAAAALVADASMGKDLGSIRRFYFFDRSQ